MDSIAYVTVEITDSLLNISFLPRTLVVCIISCAIQLLRKNKSMLYWDKKLFILKEEKVEKFFRFQFDTLRVH